MKHVPPRRGLQKAGTSLGHKQRARRAYVLELGGVEALDARRCESVSACAVDDQFVGESARSLGHLFKEVLQVGIAHHTVAASGLRPAVAAEFVCGFGAGGTACAQGDVVVVAVGGEREYHTDAVAYGERGGVSFQGFPLAFAAHFEPAGDVQSLSACHHVLNGEGVTGIYAAPRHAVVITNVCGLIDIKDQNVDKRYLLHWLTLVAKTYVYKGMGNPKLMSNVMATVNIALPPLPIQQKIAEILDKFAELEAELEARRKQYEYYREKLLTFSKDDENVKWYTLGEIGKMIRGNGIQKKDFTETGIGCIHYGQIYTRYGTFADKTISFISEEQAERCKKASYGDLIIATTSENVEDVCKAVGWIGKEEIAISGDAYVFKHNQDPRYIAYLFQTQQFLNYKKKYATGTKVIRVSGENMLKFSFGFPPLSEQRRIADILDNQRGAQLQAIWHARRWRLHLAHNG